MTEPVQRNPRDAELISRIGETSLRLMAGVVPKDVIARLQARLFATTDQYPWEEVVDAVLAEPVDDGELVNKGLVAQRNWLLRDKSSDAQTAGQRRRGPSVETRAKTALAVLIVRGGFFVLYTAAIIAVLVLLKNKFPGFDIYRILDGLGAIFPSMFGR